MFMFCIEIPPACLRSSGRSHARSINSERNEARNWVRFAKTGAF
jgi:hypothetical protein